MAKKIVNRLKPFSVTMEPLIQDILAKEKIVERYAGMATMERIKGLFSTHLSLVSGAISDTTLEDSSKLQEVRDVIIQIRQEMKPLAKLDGTSRFQRFPTQKPSIHFLYSDSDKANI